MFTISVQDRKSDNSEKFGEGESKRICSQITRETGAEIEISTSKNMNLTFLVRGKEDHVTEAKRRIIASFQTQVKFFFINIILPPNNNYFFANISKM